MSSNYSAGQYDDAFNPRRLGNWEVAKESYTPTIKHCSSISRVIANENGHLLPNVYRNSCTSPWGNLDEAQWLGDSLYTIPQPKITPTPKIGKKVIPKFYKEKITPKVQKIIEPSPDYELTNEDIVLKLKSLQLPVIWVIGLPTRRILTSRRNFCKQLADTLEFTYINLDECIDTWRGRQKNSTEEKTPLKGGNNRKFEHAVQKITHRHLLKRAREREKPNICVETVDKLSPKEIHFRDETLSPSYEDCRFRYKSENGYTQNSGTKTDESSSEKKTYRLSFDLNEFFSRETIFEMFQFAMFDSLPTNGFVIEGFPYDRAEAAAWETVLYPSALALYFMEGKPTKKIKEIESQLNVDVIKQRAQYHKHNVSSEGYSKAKKMIPVIPKHVRRFLPYSLPEAERICRKYGHKLIRIINAEDVVFGGMNFLSVLVEKALSQYSNILSGKTKINYASEMEHDSYISSRGEETSCEEKGLANFLPHPITPEVTKVTKVKAPRKYKYISKAVTVKPPKVRAPRYFHNSYHKPINRMESDTSMSIVSAKPLTPPSSYEYCLPTATLFTMGDPRSASLSRTDEEDFDELEVSSAASVDNDANHIPRTPFSWTSEKVADDERDIGESSWASWDAETSSSVLSSQNNSRESLNPYLDSQSPGNDVRKPSRPSTNGSSLYRFFDTTIPRPESEKYHYSRLSRQPHNTESEENLSETEDSTSLTCAGDSRKHENYMYTTTVSSGSRSGQTNLIHSNNGDSCYTRQFDRKALNDEYQNYESMSAMERDRIRGEWGDMPGDRGGGDQSMNSQVNPDDTNSEKVNRAGKDFESHYFVYSSRPNRI